jgi:hypothetical protein
MNLVLQSPVFAGCAFTKYLNAVLFSSELYSDMQYICHVKGTPAFPGLSV